MPTTGGDDDRDETEEEKQRQADALKRYQAELEAARKRAAERQQDNQGPQQGGKR